MASRTQLICLCEGRKRKSIDEVFINRLVKSLQPGWLRPWPGNSAVRIVSCGNRDDVISELPKELKSCRSAGGDTTVMVWADCDDDCGSPDALVARFWSHAAQNGITKAEFDRVIFCLPKDRIENWVEFLNSGSTNESAEGPRARHNRDVADAARKLAALCKAGGSGERLPSSLQWACRNWHAGTGRLDKS